jgi:predicted nucleotidyltransferase
MIDVSDDELKIIKEILQNHGKSYEVRVFGSRYKGNAKKTSDLDLAIIEKRKWICMI